MTTDPSLDPSVPADGSDPSVPDDSGDASSSDASGSSSSAPAAPSSSSSSGASAPGGVWPSVLSNWVPVNTPLEGSLPYMYLDIEGYVTTGLGDLIDPVGAALALPWKNPDGSLASASDVQAAWTAVDSLRSDPKGQVQTSGPATQYGGAFGGYTTIRLDAAGIAQAANTALTADIASMGHYFPKSASWPADAQFAVLSMMWAMGSGFPASFPQFSAAMNAGQFAAAAPLSVFQGNGVEKRIAMNQQMLLNAQQVVDKGADPSVLYWPGPVSGGLLRTLALVGGTLVALSGVAVMLHHMITRKTSKAA